MTKMCHVSVIIPVRNRPKLIERAVRSVLAQTYQEIEIIIVDDGSTDTTPNAVAILAEEDPRIHWIQHDTNRGAQAARNTGIRAARGDWVAFLDSDDQWLPNSLQLRLELAMRKEYHVVHSACLVLDSGHTEPQEFADIPPTQGQAYKELLRSPGPMFQGLLVARRALVHIDYLDEDIISYQEWDTAIRLAKYYTFGFVHEPTFIWHQRDGDAISNDLLRAAEGYKQVFSKHRWSILRYLGPRGLAYHYQTAAHWYRDAKNQAQAHRCERLAFLLWPFRPRTILRRVLRLFHL